MGKKTNITKFRPQFILQTFENRMKEILAECCKENITLFDFMQ